MKKVDIHSVECAACGLAGNLDEDKLCQHCAAEREVEGDAFIERREMYRQRRYAKAALKV